MRLRLQPPRTVSPARADDDIATQKRAGTAVRNGGLRKRPIEAGAQHRSAIRGRSGTNCPDGEPDPVRGTNKLERLRGFRIKVVISGLLPRGTSPERCYMRVVS